MLKLFIGKDKAEVKIFQFPAGESGVSYCWDNSRTRYETDLAGMITLNWENNEDLINLALLVDAVRRDHPHIQLSLEIPYFCYSRQDRVCNKGESLSVAVIAKFINSLEFKRVYVLDPHSDVLGAVLNNMVEVDNRPNVQRAVHALQRMGPENDWYPKIALVSPDAGALKKVYRYAKFCGNVDVIRADKSRDVATGKITGTVVYSEHLGNTNLLVVDDLADGAGTFIPLAAELRKITDGSVSLFVTHGLFTKGVDIVADVFDNIYVVNDMHTKVGEQRHPKLIVIN